MSLLDCFGFLFRSRHDYERQPTPQPAPARSSHDPHHLDRFLRAREAPQGPSTAMGHALNEIRRGRVSGHWLGFVFPRLAGSGPAARRDPFAIASIEDARAYVSSPALRPGLNVALDRLTLDGNIPRNPETVFGHEGAQHFWASITLFAHVTGEKMFTTALSKFFDGKGHPGTLDELARLMPKPRPPRPEPLPRARIGTRQSVRTRKPTLADKFVTAQRSPIGGAAFWNRKPAIDRAVAEIAAGRKTSHWMWFIFPQMAGLGRSKTSCHFALQSREEAREYMSNAGLKANLDRCLDALLSESNKSRGAKKIFGRDDAKKLHSSLTLFCQSATDFRLQAKLVRALDEFFSGKHDDDTIALIKRQESAAHSR